MSIAPVHRHANSTRPHRGIVHSTSTHSTSTQHTIALRKRHTVHSHTRADRASCPQQKSAGARSAHTQNTSMHKANRGGSRHNTGTKGAGTCMTARAGTGYGVYTRSASSMLVTIAARCSRAQSFSPRQSIQLLAVWARAMLALAPFGQSLLHTDMPTPRDRIMIETTAFGVGQGVRQMHVYEQERTPFRGIRGR